MTTNNLFAVILKTMGLLMFKDFLLASVGAINLFRMPVPEGNFVESFGQYLILGLPLFAYLLATLIFLFRTEWMIKTFQLEKGLEAEVQVKMHRSDILRIAVIVMGGLVLADSIPNLFRSIAGYWQQKMMMNRYADTRFLETGFIVQYFIRSLIGIGLIASQRTLVNFIESRRKSPRAPQILDGK